MVVELRNIDIVQLYTYISMHVYTVYLGDFRKEKQFLSA